MPSTPISLYYGEGRIEKTHREGVTRDMGGLNYASPINSCVLNARFPADGNFGGAALLEECCWGQAQRCHSWLSLARDQLIPLLLLPA